jgi:RNA polymerase sigma factor (sigma-70 family)
VLEDTILIFKLKRGDRGALSRIYEKYRDDLLRIAAGLLREQHDAEDIVHDVFAGFVRGCGQFTLTGSLGGYLTTCVVNGARTLYRARSRHGTVTLDTCEPPVANRRRPEEWLILDEDFRRLQNALHQLPDEQREAVVLRLQADMRFKDIARLQATSVKTAASRYQYGITKLRTLMNGEVDK